MTPLLGYLVSAGGFALLSLVAVASMIVRPRSVAARRAVVAIVLVYAAASARLVPWILSRPLVSGLRPFTTADAAGGSAAIVLLAAGTFNVDRKSTRL